MVSNIRTWAGAALAALALCAGARAEVRPSDYQELTWRSIGPFRGGRVLAVSGASDDRLHFVFGAVNGGVWETRDAGRTWSPIFDGQPVGSIGALAFAPSDPKTLYVGTGEADMRSDIAQGVGMFKTTDGGGAWSAIGLGDTQQIARILVDPHDPNLLLVAALGHPYGPNPERGVFRSSDGGRTWSRTLFLDADTGAVDLAFKPGDPNVVYAALWQTRRPPWSVYAPSSGPGGGLYKSVDGGRSFTRLNGPGLPAHFGRVGFAVSPAAPDRVYALIDDPKEGGLYRSEDDGAHWTRTTADPRIWQRGWYFAGVTADPRDPDTVWVCNTIVLKSSDGGRSFVPQKGDPTGDDFHTLWIDPADPGRRILGVDQGALVSLNGGATWSSWFNQPTGQFYHVITDTRFPYRVYGAQQDSGAAAVPSRTGTVDGIGMPQFHEITAGGESDEIAPDPDDPDTVFGGRVSKLDLRTGQTRDVDPTLAYPGRYRGEWTLPLTFGRFDHALYFGDQRLFRTTDGGAHWTPISPDLTRPDPGIPPNLDPPAAADDTGDPGPRKGVIYAIGPSPVQKGLLWVGTDDGLVWKSLDEGRSWTDVTPRGLPAWSKIGTLEPSHFDPATAYIAVDRHRLDDFSPYVYATHDGGRSWSSISRGLDAGGTLNAVNVVREDPERRGLLYAGTERGVFVSFDDGGQWRPLQQGLPRTSIRDLVVKDADLVIATHGRGFYVLDDLEPLRQLGSGAPPILFAPVAAHRVRPQGFTGTPMPADEPKAPNPPDGAYLDYDLPEGVRGPVQLSVYDAAGDLVRRIRSDAPRRPAPDLATLDVAPEWVSAEQRLRASPGQHRYVWDLRYAPPPLLASSGGERPYRGVWAPPGLYTVELTVDGVTTRAPLEVLPDPRVTAPPESYRREFQLARALEGDRAAVKAALVEARALQSRLAARGDEGSGPRPDPAAPVKAGLERLAGPAEAPVAGTTGLSAAPTLTELEGALGALEEAVDGADGGPSADAVTGSARTSALARSALVQFAALRSAALTALGGEVSPAGDPARTPPIVRP